MEKKTGRLAVWLHSYGMVIVTGLLIGAAAVGLTALGNPKNMGFCIACFLRDIAGALKLQTAGAAVVIAEDGLSAAMGTGIVQYMRPEIAGLVLGAFLLSLIRKEWRPMGGSSPMTRFLIAVFVMIGALVFLGCPLRMVIRIGGGDLNAVVGLAGFVIGIGIGVIPVKLGFSLRRAYRQSVVEGLIFPVLMLALLLVSVFGKLLVSSTGGPGSQHAPVLAALLISLVIGALCQQSRLCMAGGVRDAMLFGDFRLLGGFGAILAAVLVGNTIVNGAFPAFSFADQPIALTEWLWNLLGMVLVGWGSVLLGGCPLRQLILAGEGNTDSAVTVTGFIVGAAIAHNFGLASSGSGIGSGPVALTVVAGLLALAVISIVNTVKKEA